MPLSEFLTTHENPFTKEKQRTLDWAGLAAFSDPVTWFAPMSQPAKDVPLSRLGGRPVMAPDTPWPTASSGPMTFAAQVDFAELTKLGRTDGPSCPDNGVLELFVDVENLGLGFPTEGWKVLYVVDARGERPHPSGSHELPVTPLRFGWVRGKAPNRRALVESIRAGTFIAPTRDEEPAPDHRVLGPPDWLDDRYDGFFVDPRVELVLGDQGLKAEKKALEKAEKRGLDVVATVRQAREWIVLWQLESDERSGLCWGDCGTLYLLVRRSDLAAHRFDQVRCVVQSS